MRKAPNAQVYFALAGLTFFGSVGFLFMQNQRLDSKRAEVARMTEQSKEQQEIYKKLDASKQELADLKTKLSHLEAGVPDAAYVPTMLKDLELVGKAHGIEVTGLRPAQAKTPPPSKDKDVTTQKPYQPLDLELKGRGRYFDVVTFIEALNVFPEIVTVRTVGLSPAMSANKTGDKTLEVTIGLRAFLFKQAPAAKAAAGSQT